MVRRDVEQRRGIGGKRRAEVDLEGRQLEHIGEARRKLRKIEDGVADIAAKSDRPAAHLQQMRGERGRGGFAVGAGDDHDFGARILFGRSRKKSSVSPMTSTPAACACFTLQCGSGWVRGMPGASTRAAIPLQSALERSCSVTPCAAALSREACVSSQASTRAPPVASAWAAAMPLKPSPNTATSRPGKVVTGIIAESTAISAWRGQGAQAPRR